MSSARGLSLVEVLLATVLFLLVGTLIMQVLLPMAPGLMRGSQQSELQQLSFLTLDRWAKEIEQTTPAGMELVSPSPGEPPVRFAMRPLTGVGAGGGQQYANECILYWWDNLAQKLWRSTWSPSGPPKMLPNSSDFDGVVASPPNTTRVLIGGVTQLQIALLPGGGPPTSQVSLQLSLQAPPVDNRPPETFVIQRQVVLHNTNYLP